MRHRSRRFVGLLTFALAISLALGNAVQAQSVPHIAPQERQLGERILGSGSWGADVFALQTHLRKLGYDITADGLFGARTREAVIRFQTENALEASGSVGPATLRALSVALISTIETMPYIVKPGDSLWSIARTFDTKMELLVDLNEFSGWLLTVGQTIKVPAMLRYTVESGDTLWDIAALYHTSVRAIAELNGMDPDAVMRVGTRLWLPRDAFRLEDATPDARR